MPAEELGHIIFTSVRQDLLHEENLYTLLRILWLKANIFLCQGDIDIVIETLELVRNFSLNFERKHSTLLWIVDINFQLLNRLQEMESRSLNPCITLLNCKNNSQISAKLVKRKLTSIQRYFQYYIVWNKYSNEYYNTICNYTYTGVKN